MTIDPPSNETADWDNPSESEVRIVSGAFVAAPGAPQQLTELQAVTIAAITHSMTGYRFDLNTLPVTSPEDLATTLALRAAAWRSRILHGMLIGALLLEELPPEIQARLESYADAVGVHDDMLAVTSQLAAGSLTAAMKDFQRSGYEGDWTQSGSLRTDRQLDSACALVDDDPELAARWAALAGCPRGSLGRGVFEFSETRGFSFLGQPGSAPPPLAQHDWVHVLADYGSTVESEIEAFRSIATANENPRAFSLQPMVLSLFEIGSLASGAGLFEASSGHLSKAGDAMAIRMGDAMRWGFIAGTSAGGQDLLSIDSFSHADEALEDVRRPDRSDLARSRVGPARPWRVTADPAIRPRPTDGRPSSRGPVSTTWCPRRRDCRHDGRRRRLLRRHRAPRTRDRLPARLVRQCPRRRRHRPPHATSHHRPVASPPDSEAGVSSAMNDTSREVGGAIGIAVVGSLISIGYRNGVDRAIRTLTGTAAHDATDSLGGLLNVAKDLDVTASQTLVAARRAAFTDGMRLGMFTAAGVLLTTALAIGLLHPRRPPSSTPPA